MLLLVIMIVVADDVVRFTLVQRLVVRLVIVDDSVHTGSVV